MKTFFCCLLIVIASCVTAQDTTVEVGQKVVTLTEVVVRNKMDVPGFIRRIQADTSFYRAFKNLRQLNYTSLNDIRMLDKTGNPVASLQSRTRQYFDQECRTMEVMEEKSRGPIRRENGDWNYYTAEMYAGLFFTDGQVCNQDNSVATAELNLRKKNGIEKHKEQLKMLFFNPGRRIPGIPFIGDKINIYDPPMSDLYEFEVDMELYQGTNCYTFRIFPKENLDKRQRKDLVIRKVNTWFDARDMRIVARNYELKYDAGVYDFDVQMEVEMGRFGDMLVPVTLRYTGNWKVVTRKRERGVFTATIFDFRN